MKKITRNFENVETYCQQEESWLTEQEEILPP